MSECSAYNNTEVKFAARPTRGGHNALTMFHLNDLSELSHIFIIITIMKSYTQSTSTYEKGHRNKNRRTF